MAINIDAKGLTCPAPVLLVKDAVEQDNPSSLTVLVDNQAACENVSRFLTSKGFEVKDSKDGENFIIEAAGDGEFITASETEVKAKTHQTDDTVQKNLIIISSDKIGSGDDELGAGLMINYIKTIKEMGDELWQVIFINGGVKMTIDTSPVLTELQAYEQDGVIILACGTCLEHFGLTARKQVGGATNMLDIVTATQLADKVVWMG